MKTNEEYVEEFIEELKLTSRGKFYKGNLDGTLVVLASAENWLRTTIEEVRREERERIGKTMREVYERRTRQLDAIRGSAERPFAVAGIDLQYNFMQEVLQALTPTNPDKQEV